MDYLPEVGQLRLRSPQLSQATSSHKLQLAPAGWHWLSLVRKEQNLVRPQQSTWTKMVYLLPVCFVLLGGGLVGCSNSAPFGIGGINFSNASGNVTKISDIQKNQNAATVYIQGQVVTRAPFLVAGAYKVQDATGAIWVLTNQTIPNVGDEVLIKGQLQFQSIPVGGQNLDEVYVQEEQQLQRKAGQPRQPVPTQGSLK